MTNLLHLSDRRMAGLDNSFALSMAANSGNGEIVFVDPTVPNYLAQINGVEEWGEVFILDPFADGVEQIAAELKPRWDLARVHILAHGMPGAVILGTATLCAQTFGLYARKIHAWGRALNPTAGEVIFYGSDLGRGEAGEYFLRRISDMTQAGASATPGRLLEARRLVA
jgi:hypothetical protein